MKFRVLLIVAGCLSSNVTWGEACQVLTRAAGQGIAVVQPQTCYEYKGVAPGTIDWSCSNEDKDASPADKRKIDACPSGAQASCTATLTQEALANERSTSKEADKDSTNLPPDAQVVTLYYELTPQARIDCERGGGQWKTLSP
ncbi:hypothetical protein CFII64_14625 [Pseudomonas sp. CFII64]|jgi:hypothetical protein|uniref:hypothetical protein n=1 Tax=Pseudomonas sp. CFII64 TaxID=911242 RepID=UPI000356F1D2|nr:hypothetical protein [Pseudomonas sp. CFII64]EPJ84298.1 hypothetical protein CFII64_14625 [Pseudomonas sp. CFII64]